MIFLFDNFQHLNQHLTDIHRVQPNQMLKDPNSSKQNYLRSLIFIRSNGLSIFLIDSFAGAFVRTSINLFEIIVSIFRVFFFFFIKQTFQAKEVLQVV